jgi:hypothetical protein
MSDYTMPEAKLGDLVRFYAHEGADPVMAFVTQSASRTLTLWAVVPGYGGVEKVSVHHKDDPGLAEFPAWKETGLWDALPSDPRIAVLSERVSLLEKKVNAVAPKKA